MMILNAQTHQSFQIGYSSAFLSSEYSLMAIREYSLDKNALE